MHLWTPGKETDFRLVHFFGDSEVLPDLWHLVVMTTVTEAPNETQSTYVCSCARLEISW